MSFDISRLTSAVNKYLNSISDVTASAEKTAQEMADRTQFANDLGEAIRQNIASRAKDVAEIPDIQSIVQQQVESATASIRSTFERVNGAFVEIQDNTKSSSVKELSASETSGSNANSAATNKDAYAGILSTEALQELSKSQYFSANLLQSSLFDESDGTSTSKSNSGTSSSGTSAFDTVSLSDLNLSSLTKSSLGTTGTASELIANAVSSLSGSTNSTDSTANTITANTTDSSDLAKALIKAYTQSGKTSSVTSIFGDFSL